MHEQRIIAVELEQQTFGKQLDEAEAQRQLWKARLSTQNLHAILQVRRYIWSIETDFCV